MAKIIAFPPKKIPELQRFPLRLFLSAQHRHTTSLNLQPDRHKAKAVIARIDSHDLRRNAPRVYKRVEEPNTGF
jgi:hypothetical protein